MGVNIMERSCRFYTATNPNPKNFKINRFEQINGYVLAEITYPDCKNYEGRKILLFKAASMSKIILNNFGIIDPHFDNAKNVISPIARFEPTQDGWNMALKLIKELS